MKIIHLGLTKLLRSFVQQYSYGPKQNFLICYFTGWTVKVNEYETEDCNILLNTYLLLSAKFGLVEKYRKLYNNLTEVAQFSPTFYCHWNVSCLKKSFNFLTTNDDMNRFWQVTFKDVERYKLRARIVKKESTVCWHKNFYSSFPSYQYNFSN